MDGLAGGRCTAHGLHLSVVGGAVRDRLLGKNTPDKDLDLGGRGRQLASHPAAGTHREPGTAEGFQLKQSQSFEAFGTDQLRLNTPAGQMLCDLSSARSERYAFPGAHPEVQPTDLAGDLKRRDFSINAMAERLPLGSSQLIDPFAGEADLKAGQLKLLPPQPSRRPSRLLRGVRYGARLGLQLAPETGQVESRWPPGHGPTTRQLWPPLTDGTGAAVSELLATSTKAPRDVARIGADPAGLEALPRRSEAWLQRLGQWGHAIDPNWSSEELRLVGLLWLVPHQNNLLAIAERLQLAHRHQHCSPQLGTQSWLQSLP